MFFEFGLADTENSGQRMIDPEHVFGTLGGVCSSNTDKGGYLNICLHPFDLRPRGAAHRHARPADPSRMKALPSVGLPTCGDGAALPRYLARLG